MHRTAVAALAALGVLGGCATIRDSAVNPFNWFGRSTEETTLVPEGGWPERRDNRALVEQVIELAVHPVSGGALVQAVGLPPTQGWWDAELRPEGDELRAAGGVLRLDFVLAEPRTAQRAGPPQSREVSAGLFVPNARLDGVRQITVTGSRNARTVARR